jgi:hypothetical protein
MQEIKINLLKNKRFLDKLKMCSTNEAFLACINEMAAIEQMEPRPAEWENELATQGKIDVSLLNPGQLMNGRNNNCFNNDAPDKVNR